MFTCQEEKAAKIFAIVIRNNESDVRQIIDQRRQDLRKFEEYISAVKVLLHHCEEFVEGKS